MGDNNKEKNTYNRSQWLPGLDACKFDNIQSYIIDLLMIYQTNRSRIETKLERNSLLFMIPNISVIIVPLSSINLEKIQA